LVQSTGTDDQPEGVPACLPFLFTARKARANQSSIHGSKSKKSSSHEESDRLFVQSAFFDGCFSIPPVSTSCGTPFLSLKYLKLSDLWTGAIALPELPSLLYLSVGFHADRDGYDGPDASCVVMADFANLLRLKSLKITRMDQGVFITFGEPRCLQQFEMCDSFVDWSFLPLIANISSDLKSIRMTECGISYNNPSRSSLMRGSLCLSNLQKLELNDSINFLPMLLPEEPGSLEEVVIQLGDNDFEEDWDHLKRLLALLPKEWNSIKLTDRHNHGFSSHELENWEAFERYYKNYFIQLQNNLSV
jgi:hypothetical protein